MKNLKNFVEECKNDILSLGIELGNIKEVIVNTRAKSRWGQCSYHIHGDNYTISISNRLLSDDVSDMSLKNTIAHELLHTIQGGMSHTGPWKKCADLLNSVYGYEVKRATSCEEKGVEIKQTSVPRYKVKCNGCGKVWKYYRKCRTIKLLLDNKGACRCPRCNSHDFTVFKKEV